MSEETVDDNLAGRIGEDTVLAQVEGRFRSGGKAIGVLAASSLLVVAGVVLAPTVFPSLAPDAAATPELVPLKPPPSAEPVAAAAAIPQDEPAEVDGTEQTAEADGTAEADDAVQTDGADASDTRHASAGTPHEEAAAAAPADITAGAAPRPPATAPKAPAGPAAPVVVRFDFNQMQAGFSDATKAELATFAKACTGRVTLTGHTCNIGKESVNQVMGLIRAEAVAALLADHGLSRDRMAVQSSGSESPAYANDTEEGRRRNRRVDVVCDES
ncbi:MAG: OmpA family protein [Myxococcales bacterium]|nr:OmpA family protein [Myxococcales bacterium]